MRAAQQEMGNVHYQYGFNIDAIKAWSKAHDFCQSSEKLSEVATRIAVAAFEALNIYQMNKFSGEVEAREKSPNSPLATAMKIMDCVGSLAKNLNQAAVLKLVQIHFVEDPMVTNLITQSDLAHYIVFATLSSDLTRKSIKKDVVEGDSCFKCSLFL